VRIGRRAAEGIVELAAEDEADLIIFGWGGRPGGKRGAEAVFSPTIDEVVRDSPCDIAVVKQRGVKHVQRILTPVRGGPHAELALTFAASLGRYFEATVDVMHVVPDDITPVVRAQAERALTTFVRQHAGDPARPLLVAGHDVGATILKQADSAELVVMGATAMSAADAARSDGALFGALPENIAQQARPTVIVVKTKEPLTRATFEKRAEQAETLEAADRAALAGRSIPARVDRWFAESNYHHGEFADLGRLVELKQKQRLTISAVLPTLNESATIGPIVRAARRELMERHRLLDELLVIDSDSDDDTRQIAEEEGARVAIHSHVLARYGSYRGKGEALWKSLYETSGDLVVWSDTDIVDWHPRFIYGTLGPLLVEPRIGYVKGYYQRPIVEGGILKEGGGGRVTELVARPLINMFFPELSGYIQPLAGEYAGRRAHLEQIPFFTGYAVEIGHLIDLAERLGLNGFGQVDLELRIHRNQELEGLSRMSFVILQAVMKRLEERHKARLFPELGSTMKLPRSGPHRLSLEVIDLADQERPPIVRIPEYAERRSAVATPA
ncbi:MAG: glucosyl-3-phosphoglycerate synthase, partial [Chloroflexota bacterium]|nr:glucosyl-3-phosphoglycerate synthase [Chloroflexota bacterium]